MKIKLDKLLEELIVQFFPDIQLLTLNQLVGKILRFKEEGDLFEFGKNKYTIVSIS